MTLELTPFLQAEARRKGWTVAATLAVLAVVWGFLRLGTLWWVHETFPASTLVTDRTGAVLRLTTATDGQYRLWTALGDFAPQTIEAVLLKEDRSFWTHPGVDGPALVRAAWNSLVTRDYRSGASTVTMQTVRLVWGLDTATLPGKLVQILGAFTVTLLVSKADVLEVYLNLAPCGGNVQGLGTAARIWFGKAPGQVNLSESLALAVLPQDPAHRNPADPSDHPAIDQARARLAQTWVALHTSPADSDTLASQLAMPLSFRRELPFLAPHLTTRLIADNPSRHLLRTTLDPSLQRLVEGAIRRFTRRNASVGVTNASALIVKAETLEVLASVGSADFHNDAIQGQVDGTRAPRSPGSTLKPFLYGLALEQGLIHPLTTLKDARVHFGSYNPDNFDNDFEGPIRTVDALIKSRNVPAVILSGQVKSPDLYDFLQGAGLKLPFSRDHYGLSLILGGAEVTMIDLVRLYASLAGSGNRVGTTGALRYLFDEEPPRRTRLFSPEAAWLVRKMLETKPRPDADEGWNANPLLDDSATVLGRTTGQVAYKTGTSIGFRDAWSVGIADELIVAVWVGDFAGASNPEFIGLQTAAPLMFEIVDAWRADAVPEPPEDQRLPDNIVFVPVCAVSGGIATADCPRLTEAPFIAGVSPIAPCSVHQVFHIDQITGLRRARALADVTKPVLYEVWPSDILELFAQAGLGRAIPPAFDPSDDTSLGAHSGWKPQVLSPVKGLIYHSNAPGERIPLAAAIGSDSQEAWWFMDDKVIGRAARGENLLWVPTSGTHRARVVDGQGRSAEVVFEVAP